MTLTCDDVRDLAAGFVLGALTPEDEAAVRDHLATCPEAHAEIAELGGVVPYLAESLEPVEPPAGLRARLLAAAAERPAPATTPAAEPPVDAPAARSGPPMAPIPFPSADEREGRIARRTGVADWAVRIAAVLAVVVLGAWNLQLQGRVSDAEGQLRAATDYQAGVARVLDVAVQDGAITAVIAPTPDGPSDAAGLAASGPDGTVVIAMQGLAPTTGTEVYEAWVIVGSDAPVPLGGFAVDASGTGVLSTSTALAQPGALLALTREPAGGATTPTLPVLSAGALGGG